MAETKLEEMIRLRQPPAAHGCSDGPGSMRNEVVFDRPDVEKETRIQLQALEDAGKLKDPAAKKQAEAVMEHAKSIPKTNTDYQKGGHPADG